MNWLPLLPLITCFSVIILNCFFWRYVSLQKSIQLVGSIVLLFVTVILFYAVLQHEILVVQVGNFPAPFGITFVIDMLSAIMLLITGIIGFGLLAFALVLVRRVWRMFHTTDIDLIRYSESHHLQVPEGDV